MGYIYQCKSWNKAWTNLYLITQSFVGACGLPYNLSNWDNFHMQQGAVFSASKYKTVVIMTEFIFRKPQNRRVDIHHGRN